MSKTIREEKEERVPWPWIIAFTIAWSILGTILAGFLGPATSAFSWTYILGHTMPHSGFITTPYAFIPIIWALVVLFPKLKSRFSLKTLAYAYATIMITAAYANFRFPWCPLNAYWHPRVEDSELYGVFLPEFWLPKKEVLEPAITGGASVPWGEWLPTLCFWWIMMISGYFFAVSLNNIYRRLIFNIERLPYPYAEACFPLIQAIPGVGLYSRPKRRRLLLYSSIVSFIFYLQLTFIWLFPWFPDVIGWKRQPWFDPGCMGMFMADKLWPALTSKIPGFPTLNVDPVWSVVSYVLPLSTSFSMWVTYAVIMIIVQIAWTMGYYTGIEAPGTIPWTKRDRFGMEPPLKLFAFGLNGMVLGIAVFSILINWRYFTDTIRMAIKGGGREEANEPQSYRMAYLTLIVSGAILIAGLMACEIPFAGAFLLLLVHSVIGNITRILTHGSAGFVGEICWRSQQGYFKWLFPDVLRAGQPARTRAYVMTMSLAGITDENLQFPFNTYQAFFISDVYAIANRAGVSNRNIFKVMSLSAIVSILISIPVAVALWYYVGYYRLPVGKEWEWLNQSDVTNVLPAPAEEPWWPWALAGFVFSGLIMYLRFRFVWFPLDVYGIYIGATAYYLCTIPGCFIGWLLKYITLKIGGTRYFEEYGLPIASGWLIGYSVSILVNGIIAVIRFAIPIG